MSIEPGTYITIAQIAFQGACVAVKTFQNGLNFGEDAERLVLGLEVERFRLQIWGENAGLAPRDGQPATLSSRLLPLCGILKDYLEQIEQLVKDADVLSSRYGLLQTEEPPTKSTLIRQLVQRMQRSIHLSGIRLAADNDAANEAEGEERGSQGTADAALEIEDLSLSKEKRKTTTWKRVRWAVRDLDRFDDLVRDLGQRINKLNDLMTETQQRKTREDNYRVNMVVVGSAVDEASLELIRAAVRGEPDTSQVRTAVERKALTQPRRVNISAMSLQQLSLDEFALPAGFANLKRFVTTKQSDSAEGPYYLLERKKFDPDIQSRDMIRLTNRIQRLVLLLQKPKSPDFRTPQALGCITDSANTCWWIVFHFPLRTLPQPDITRRILRKEGSAPISLLSLLPLLNPNEKDPKGKIKFLPPLEQRLALASTVCATLSELYLSGWLHKGVRSENILFPAAGAIMQPPPYSYTSEEMQTILSSPLVCGFDYSRHESEWSSIDRARRSCDLDAAIYRHPSYQGEAAEGYKIQYDIYSVGLVLVEIALWRRLKSFLKGRRSSSKTSAAPRPAPSLLEVQLGVSNQPASVELWENMESFHAPHAAELRKRVIDTVNSELAFRVGSPFCQAVRFCLEFADKHQDVETSDGSEVGVHPAMEFYNNVVVPLAELSSSQAQGNC
ncbi:Prion-inhibition and propagation-domain-containing protein [Madurella fahalii]|uniref:Prion-inhibition and propagation-domain-containing protein n=1 Tax=Madurella fahalii TaxID=1157608 RepID=A0ABQ0GQ79_9PEZI